MRIIAGSARGTTLVAPEGLDTRPTLDRVRENIFNLLQGRVRDKRVLDLFSGSGAMALEALSRGAAMAVLVDHDRRANAAERKNIAKLRMESVSRVLLASWRQAVAALTAEGARFDLVFLDPPYEMSDLRPVMTALIPLLAADALLVVEHAGKAFPATPEGFEMTDSRRYGIAGVSLFRQVRTDDE